MSKQLGNKLSFLRSRNGFTQNQIAEQINVDRSTYSNYERAVTEPDVKTIKKLAKIFGVDVNELLSYADEKPRVADGGGMAVYSLTKEEKEFLVCFRMLNGDEKQDIHSRMKKFIKDKQ
ncbi:MAG: helix-turn-helix transcriptional regulator [Ruminococcus sp.]|nr:helix-turn-helix transcriptional regulator [Ruminococcus sp.]